MTRPQVGDRTSLPRSGRRGSRPAEGESAPAAADRRTPRQRPSRDPPDLSARHACGLRNVRKSGGGGNRTRETFPTAKLPVCRPAGSAAGTHGESRAQGTRDRGTLGKWVTSEARSLGGRSWAVAYPPTRVWSRGPTARSPAGWPGFVVSVTCLYRKPATRSRWPWPACCRSAAGGFGAPGNRSSPIVGMNCGGTRTCVACS